MFFFGRKHKSKKSLLNIIADLRDFSVRSELDIDFLNKIQISNAHHYDWKAIDNEIAGLIRKLRYTQNDKNTQTMQTILGYIAKLLDSRIGVSSFYESLKNNQEERQLMAYAIESAEYNDKIERSRS